MCFIILLGAMSAQGTVHFADDNLKTAIQEALFLWGDPTAEDMQWRTRLELRYKGITDLTGIEAAINLQILNLRGNHVTDVSPLESLTQLTVLNISENDLSDLSGVTTLTQLRSLDVHGNGISDLSPLSAMTQLESLTLRDNNFQGDVSALSSLTRLEYLDLQENRIQHLSDLRRLTKLKHLYLYYNWIMDISVLAKMTNLETLDLRHNILSNISSLTELRHLKKLSLQDNPLGRQAYRDLSTIKDNNPDVDLTYDASHAPPSVLQATQGAFPDCVKVTWDEVANGPSYTSYYKVFRAASQGGAKVPVSLWQAEPSFTDAAVDLNVEYTYWVQTALSDKGLKAGEFSDPVAGYSGLAPAKMMVLSVFPGAGGSVLPEPGTHPFEQNAVVPVATESLDPNFFVFSHWVGSAVDHGKVADPNQASTSVVMDANETLVPVYQTTLETLVVDAQAVEDMNQVGTEAYPLGRIQDAVALAVDGMRVRVRAGVYQEHVDFLGKAIELVGADPEQAEPAEYPVIAGDRTGPVVRFVRGESGAAMLKGFVLTGGTSGIVCEQSSPTLLNCIVAGNWTEDPNEAAVVFVDSNAVASNLTIADNLCGLRSAALSVERSAVRMTNMIVWGNDPLSVLSAQDDESQIYFSDIEGGWTPPGSDVAFGVLDVVPEFVRPGEWIVPQEDPNGLVFVPGDYHLQSVTGYWDSVTETWLTAVGTSPCIDRGYPGYSVGLEPEPHGQWINQGAYGGTSQASLTAF